MRPVGARTNKPKSRASIACWSTPPTSGPPHRRAGLASHATPSTSLFFHCPPTQSRACSTIIPPYQVCTDTLGFGRPPTAVSQLNLVAAPQDVPAELSYTVYLDLLRDRQDIYYDKLRQS